METFWGEGTFDDKTGYRFGAGQGLVVEHAQVLLVKPLLRQIEDSTFRLVSLM